MAFNFAPAPLTNTVKVLKCGACGRDTNRALGVEGKGNAGVLILLEQPSNGHLFAHSWFGGGDTVFKELSNLGFDVREECWVAGLFPCPGSSKNYECCISKLENTITSLKPRLIITVGPTTTGAVLRLYNLRHFGVGNTTANYYGRMIPLLKTEGKWGCWLAPIQSEAEIHTIDNTAVSNVAKLWQRRQLEYALNNYAIPPVEFKFPELEILYDSGEIIKALRQASVSKYAAFDYETNCLQPEQEKAVVLSASVAFGDSNGLYRCIAFPMAAESVKLEWREFLKSQSLKIIANVKFEQRWSTVLFQQPIVNFYWDVCIGGRVLDCGGGVSGLKFLTFEHFGVIGYDDDVHPFITDDDSHYNNLAKMDVSKLLLYNGLDSVYTYGVAMKQHKQFGLEF